MQQQQATHSTVDRHLCTGNQLLFCSSAAEACRLVRRVQVAGTGHALSQSSRVSRPGPPGGWGTSHHRSPRCSGS